MKTNITISIDTNNLPFVSNEHLATLWHVSQANPAEYGNKEAGQVAEDIGYEIIKRFLRTADPYLYTHQVKDFYHVSAALSAESRAEAASS